MYGTGQSYNVSDLFSCKPLLSRSLYALEHLLLIIVIFTLFSTYLNEDYYIYF